MTGQPAVAARGLVCQFGPVRAVDDLSFEVAEGEVFGLLGPDGAGGDSLVSVAAPRILSPVPAPARSPRRPGVGPGRRVGRGHPAKRIRGAVDRVADLGGCRGAGDTDAGVAGARGAQVGDRVGGAGGRRPTLDQLAQAGGRPHGVGLAGDQQDRAGGPLDGDLGGPDGVRVLEGPLEQWPQGDRAGRAEPGRPGWRRRRGRGSGRRGRSRPVRRPARRARTRSRRLRWARRRPPPPPGPAACRPAGRARFRGTSPRRRPARPGHRGGRAARRPPARHPRPRCRPAPRPAGDAEVGDGQGREPVGGQHRRPRGRRGQAAAGAAEADRAWERAVPGRPGEQPPHPRLAHRGRRRPEGQPVPLQDRLGHPGRRWRPGRERSAGPTAAAGTARPAGPTTTARTGRPRCSCRPGWPAGRCRPPRPGRRRRSPWPGGPPRPPRRWPARPPLTRAGHRMRWSVRMPRLPCWSRAGCHPGRRNGPTTVASSCSVRPPRRSSWPRPTSWPGRSVRNTPSCVLPQPLRRPRRGR